MLCAYEALHADNHPITDPSGRPFRSTNYTAAEAKARAHNGLVKQIGASEHPPMGIVAAVLAEDEARTQRTDTALNTPTAAPSSPPSAPPSAVANEAAEDRQTRTPAPETSSTVKPPKPPKQPKPPKTPKPAREPARAPRKPKSPAAAATATTTATAPAVSG